MKNLPFRLAQKPGFKDGVITSLLLVILSTLQASVIAATAPEDREAVAPAARPLVERRMGVEVETSSIKIQATDDNKVGFTILTATRQPYVVIEEDTLDRTFRASPAFALQTQNLECRTVGGLRKPHLLKAVEFIQEVLRNLYTAGVDTLFTVLLLNGCRV